MATQDLSPARPALPGACAAQEAEHWQLTRGMVHEMRSVLTSMKIAAEVLGSPRGDDSQARHNYSSVIAEQTGRVARMLEDFSEITRPEGLSQLPEGDLADLNLALGQAGQDLAGLSRQVQVEVALAPATESALVLGHQGRVNQALRGMLEHLMITAPRGGSVEAGVGLPAAESDFAYVRYTVRPPDGGLPAAAPDWGRMSMAAARRIVEDHGGEVLDAEEAEDAVVVKLPRLRGILGNFGSPETPTSAGVGPLSLRWAA